MAHLLIAQLIYKTLIGASSFLLPTRREWRNSLVA